MGPQPEAAGHHESARHDDGAGSPAADRPSADSSRRRATSPDWIVAGSSESTFSLPQPRPGKDVAANHLPSRVGIAATSRHRNVRWILRRARRAGSHLGKKSAGIVLAPRSAAASERSERRGRSGEGFPTLCRARRTTTRAGHLAMPGPMWGDPRVVRRGIRRPTHTRGGGAVRKARSRRRQATGHCRNCSGRSRGRRRTRSTRRRHGPG